MCHASPPEGLSSAHSTDCMQCAASACPALCPDMHDVEDCMSRRTREQEIPVPKGISCVMQALQRGGALHLQMVKGCIVRKTQSHSI